MPRAPRNSVKDRIVTTFMERLAVEDFSLISIREVCWHAGVDRTSFYRYYEGIEDLEQRFLHLYFHSRIDVEEKFPSNTTELSQMYQSLVLAMKDQPRFFQATFAEPRLVHYRARWRELIDLWLRRLFREADLISDPDLWNLNVHFALGVVHRYCELGFHSDTPYSLPELTRWMLEFQWGGLARLVEQGAVGFEPTLPALDKQLKKRRQSVGNTDQGGTHRRSREP